MNIVFGGLGVLVYAWQQIESAPDAQSWMLIAGIILILIGVHRGFYLTKALERTLRK